MFKKIAGVILAAALLIGAQLGFVQGAGFVPLGTPPAPNVSLDFANSNYTTNIQSITSLLTNTNSTGGFCTDGSGNLVPFAANTLRICSGTGLLVEESRTNSQVQSQAFELWGAFTGASATPNVVTAPDGTLTADKLVENSANSVHRAAQLAATVTTGQTHTFTLYAKQAERGVMLGFLSSPNFVTTGFNLATCSTQWANDNVGAIFTNKVVSSEWVGSWCRIRITATVAATSLQPLIDLSNGTTNSYLGDGTSGTYIWGAQFEQNAAFPTSYIPTTTVAATRSADNVTAVSGGGLYLAATQSAAQTAVVTANIPANTGQNNGLIYVGDDSTSNRYTTFINHPASRVLDSRVTVGGSSFNPAPTANSVTNGTPFVTAYAVNGSAASIVLNGGSVTTSSPIGVAAKTVVRLGAQQTNASPLNGTISRLTFYGSKLGDASLQAASVVGATPPAGYALDLNFATGSYSGSTPVALSSLVSVTNSGGTCTGSDGIVRSFGSNTARVCPGTGLLVEAAATNIFTASGTFTTGWAANGGPVITANAAPAADPTQSAQLVSFASGQSRLEFSGGWTNSTAYTVSVYAKPVNGVTNVGFGHFNGASDSYASFNLTTCAVSYTSTEFTNGTCTYLSNGWVRITANFTSTNTGSGIKILGSNNTNLSNNTVAGVTALLWGAQLETGSVATSYIATTSSAVARNADDVRLAGVALSSLQGSAASVVINSGAYPTVAGGDRNILGPSGGAAPVFFSISNATAKYYSYNGTVFLNSTASPAYNSGPQKLGLAFNSSGRSLTNNGNVPVTDANTYGSPSNVRLGELAPTNYRSLSLWTQRVNDTALAQLTVPDQVYADWASGTCYANSSAVDCSTLATNTQSLGGYVQNADGSLSLVAPNTLRIGKGVGLLVEESRQNVAVRSQTFTNAAWSNGANVVVTDNALVAPDGTSTAATVADNTTNGLHAIQQNFTGTVTNGVAYTASVYLKQGTNRYAQIAVSNAANAAIVGIVADLQNGVITSTLTTGSPGTVSSSMLPSYNGWYRVSVTFTNANTSYFFGIGLSNTATPAGLSISYAGTGSTIGVWGAQLEQAAFPTSYIPTTTVAVTRPADVVTAANGLSSIVSTNPKTIAFAVQSAQNAANFGRVISDNTGNSASIVMDSTSTARIISRVNSTNLFATLAAGTTSTLFRGATSMDATGRSIVGNGGTVATDAQTNSAAMTTIGSAGGATFLDGYVSRIIALGYRVPDTQLQQMTVSTDPYVSMDFAGGSNNQGSCTVGGQQVSCASLATNTNSTGGYVANNDGSMTNIPANTLRIGQGTGLLVEESRTNNTTFSQDIDNAAWTKANGAITANAVVAPDGTTTADTFTAGASVAPTGIVSAAISFTSGTTYTHSIFGKAGTNTIGQVNFPTAQFSGSGYANCNFATGQITTGGTLVASGVQFYANGFIRCWIAATATATSAGSASINLINNQSDTRSPNFTGNGLTITFWGDQVEVGAFPTSYIPTTTVAATRSADVVTPAASTMSSTAGSLVVNIGPTPSGHNHNMVSFDAASSGISNSNGSVSLVGSYNGSTSLTAALPGGTSWPTTGAKTGFAWSGTGRSIVGNAGNVGSDAASAGTFSSSGYRLGGFGSGAQIDAYMKRIDFYPFRLDDSTLRAKTQPQVN